MARLVMVQGLGPVPPLAIEDREIVLGRQADVDLMLDSREVSRRHARIIPDQERYFLEDLGSSNGTFLNSARVSGRVELQNQDQVKLGPYLFRFELSAPLEDSVVIREEVSAQSSNLILFQRDAVRQLQAVLELSSHLARTLDLDELLPRLLDHLLQLFPQADRAMILMLEDDQPVVRCLRSRRPDRGAALSYSRSVIRRVVEEGIGIVAEDASADQRFHMTQTLNKLGIRSFLCVPIKDRDGRARGAIQLDRFSLGDPFQSPDLYLLTAVSLQVAVVLENAELHEERMQQVRMRRDLALAREIQEGFLPREPPEMAAGPLDLFARVYAAREVSGDYYDYFPLDDRRLAFMVGDVSGKGIPAALFMAGVRTLSRHLASRADSPSAALRQLNDALAADNPTAMFVTVAFGIHDVRTGEVVLTTAGHPPPILRRARGATERLDLPAGRLLGFASGQLPLADTRIELAPGDALLLYSDGLTEALAPDHKTMFETDGLLPAISSLPESETLEAWAVRLHAAVREFSAATDLQDDVTLLLLRRPRP